MTKRLFLLLVFSLYLLLSPASAYVDTSFSMTLQLSPEKVHVIEKNVFLLENDGEKTAFSNSLRLGRSTISDWRAYSHNIDYHVFGPLVFFNSTKIVAKIDVSVAHRPGVVVIEYDVDRSILEKRLKSSRVTEYWFNTSQLTLDRLRSRELVLGNIDELAFNIPEGDTFSVVQPDPQQRGLNAVSFKGPMASNFEIAFIQEKTLSEEVSDFFIQTYSNAANLIPLLLVLALLLFVWYKLVSES